MKWSEGSQTTEGCLNNASLCSHCSPRMKVCEANFKASFACPRSFFAFSLRSRLIRMTLTSLVYLDSRQVHFSFRRSCIGTVVLHSGRKEMSVGLRCRSVVTRGRYSLIYPDVTTSKRIGDYWSEKGVYPLLTSFPPLRLRFGLPPINWTQKMS